MPIPNPVIYRLKAVLQGISPMIWCRLMIHGDSTIADLHFIVQIAMGWDDDHLHQFRIHGKRFGIARMGGILFYEYDFTCNWQHLIRVEAILAPEHHRRYPICIDGRRACPPEDCGGPWRFMALRQHYSFYHIMQRLLEIIVDDGNQDHCHEELEALHYWMHIDRFDRKKATHSGPFRP